jgi:hypothetical protein
MKQVVVQLAALPSGAQDEGAFARAKDFGATLKAIHPHSEDATLARWFTAQVDNAKAAEFVETLRNLPEVSAAYVKPRAAAP